MWAFQHRFAGITGVACGLVASLGQGPTFRTATQTVPTYVTVADKEGRLVPDLPKTAFLVFDNERPQPITVFSNDAQRITVAIMLDMSGSMAAELLRVRQSAQRFIDALAPGDRVRIGSFGQEIAISPLVTSDKETLMRVLREELWPSGYTPLWRALDAAMTSLGEETGRRVVLTLSDGADTDPGPKAPTPAAVASRAVRQSFVVYAIGMEKASTPLGHDLAHLAEETGGGHFELKVGADLGDTFARVADELRHQYQVGFTVPERDGKVHRVEVRVTKPGLTVRTRKSYVAPRGPS